MSVLVGKLPAGTCDKSMASWMAAAKHGDTNRIRMQMRGFYKESKKGYGL